MILKCYYSHRIFDECSRLIDLNFTRIVTWPLPPTQTDKKTEGLKSIIKICNNLFRHFFNPLTKQCWGQSLSTVSCWNCPKCSSYLTGCSGLFTLVLWGHPGWSSTPGMLDPSGIFPLYSWRSQTRQNKSYYRFSHQLVLCNTCHIV